MHKEAQEELRVRFKLVVLEHADHFGVTKACREFNVSRATFYRWKQKYDKAGRSGLYRERPVAYRHPSRTTPEVVEKILEIRAEYQLGALRNFPTFRSTSFLYSEPNHFVSLLFWKAFLPSPHKKLCRLFDALC